MPMYFPPWDTDEEPNESNVKMWLDNLYGKFEPIEQARWNQSNIDTLFYAGEQRFINSYFNFYPQYNYQQFHFNFIQQPINMVTGYQRQHRKSVNYTPIEGSDQEDADDLTKLVTYANNYRGILEKISKAYELSAISGLVLMQPYLDYTDDPINGTMDIRIWAYNEFMTSAYWREPDLSDGDFVWCQTYISKGEAKRLMPHKKDIIDTMSGYGNRYGKFYFLPENYNLARNDLLVLSYVWYQSSRKKKMLYDRKSGMTFDYVDTNKFFQQMNQLELNFRFEEIEIEVPTWKQMVILNETLMYQGLNPLGFDECPFIPVFWNYDPHVAQYDLRVRSLTRACRDTQFLLNRRVILNHDISESSINSGWLRRENTIVNEEDLRYSGQGKDIIVKDNGEPLEQCIQKIVPQAVPPSDMELANQLVDFIFRTTGVNQELMGMSQDTQAGITEMLRQGAGLVTLQKYFDQWDYAFKLFGKLEQRIILNKWSPAKMERIIGKPVSPQIQLQIFSKFDVLVSEGLNTTIQQQQQFVQMLQLNEMLGGIIPPKFLLQYATIQGKNEIIAAVEEQQKQQAEIQQQQALMEQNILEAKLQDLNSKAVSNIAMARERHGRAESNVGLFEERISEISQNRANALKSRMEALEKLLGSINTFGQLQVAVQQAKLEDMSADQDIAEDKEKIDAKIVSQSNDFLTKFLNNKPQQGNMNLEQPIGV
jgi:hypothetical protein